MTAHDADVILGHVNTDGGGAGNRSARISTDHPSERRVGRIRLDGGWDRRYQPAWRQAEPYVHDARRTVREIVGGLIVCALFVVGAWLWSGIAWAAQAPTP